MALLTGAPNPRWQYGSVRERSVSSEGCLEADESEVGRNDKAEAKGELSACGGPAWAGREHSPMKWACGTEPSVRVAALTQWE